MGITASLGIKREIIAHTIPAQKLLRVFIQMVSLIRRFDLIIIFNI